MKHAVANLAAQRWAASADPNPYVWRQQVDDVAVICVRTPTAADETHRFRASSSDLARREIVQYVLAASEGLTGEVSRILNAAAELAIRDGNESIDLHHLEQVPYLAVH